MRWKERCCRPEAFRGVILSTSIPNLNDTAPQRESRVRFPSLKIMLANNGEFHSDPITGVRWSNTTRAPHPYNFLFPGGHVDSLLNTDLLPGLLLQPFPGTAVPDLDTTPDGILGRDLGVPRPGKPPIPYR